jgi:hypothetical protein
MALIQAGSTAMIASSCDILAVLRMNNTSCLKSCWWQLLVMQLQLPTEGVR